MSFTKAKDTDKDHCADEYLALIPRNVWGLLVPANPEEHSDFCKAVHKLRVREVERDYVLDLQQTYRIPIRPNESVKATMIRVRLKIVNQRIETGNRESLFENLPVDPLE
jgi:hypothetical protein